MTTSNNSGQQTSGQLDFSLWLIRLIAYIIDGIIIFVVTAILGVIAALAFVATGSLFFFGGIWLTFGLFGLLSILYFIILDIAWGATIGKRLMGLKVQTANGAKITFMQSIIRNISKIFWVFLFLDWLIAIVTAGPDKRQKLTDRWAGTTVVQAGKAPINFSEPNYSSPPPPPTTPT